MFKIAKNYRRQGLPLYQLNYWNDEPIIGQFYGSELNKVSKDSETLFIIEKVVKRRKRQGKTELLVKWLDYPSSVNSWVSEDSVQTLENYKKIMDHILCIRFNECDDYFKDNKPYKFKVQLKNPLILKGFWTVALLEFYCTIPSKAKSGEAGLKLRVRNEKLIFLNLNQNICCGYSKEPSQ